MESEKREIKGENKELTAEQIIIETYNSLSEELDKKQKIQKVAQILNKSFGTVKNCINEAIAEGEIEKPLTTMEIAVQMYNSFDVKIAKKERIAIIAKELKKSKGTITLYINEGVKQPTIKEKACEIYNSLGEELDKREKIQRISEILNITYSSAKECINRAIRKGELENGISKVEEDKPHKVAEIDKENKMHEAAEIEEENKMHEAAEIEENEENEGKLTTKEKAIRIYRSCATELNKKQKIQMVATELGIKYNKAKDHINKAIQKGKIEEAPTMSTRDMSIEMYNALDDKLSKKEKVKMIAERLKRATDTIGGYIRDGVESGEIVEKTTLEKVVEKYNELKEELEEKKENLDENAKIQKIADELGFTVSTVQGNIYKAIREGKLEKVKVSKKAKAKELVDAGIASVNKIVEETGLTESSVQAYFYEWGVETAGLSTLDEVVLYYEIYKGDIEKIAKETNLKINTVNDNIKIAKKLGKIKRKDTPKRILEDLDCIGITDILELIRKTTLSMDTINKYISVLNMEESHIKRRKIIQALLKDLPLDVARKLKLKPYEVYNVIDDMTKVGKKEFTNRAIKRRTDIYKKIVDTRKSNKTTTRGALLLIENESESDKVLLELSKVYYMMDYEKACQRAAKKVEDKTRDEKMKLLARTIREKYQTEFLIRKIREEHIQSDFSYDVLCRKHAKTMKFMEGILGKEEREK